MSKVRVNTVVLPFVNRSTFRASRVLVHTGFFNKHAPIPAPLDAIHFGRSVETL